MGFQKLNYLDPGFYPQNLEDLRRFQWHDLDLSPY
jgi:hypothetical protein